MGGVRFVTFWLFYRFRYILFRLFQNNFYFTDINCFWLFAPLIGKLPTIETESQGVVLESYFLTEAASLLSEGLEKSIYLLRSIFIFVDHQPLGKFLLLLATNHLSTFYSPAQNTKLLTHSLNHRYTIIWRAWSTKLSRYR